MSAIMLAATLIFADPGPVRVQWVMYTAPAWCNPCVEAEADFVPWLKKSGWRVGHAATDHVRLIDIDCEVEAAKAAEINGVPTFVLLVDGKEKRRFIRYPGREFMAREYLRHYERLK